VERFIAVCFENGEHGAKNSCGSLAVQRSRRAGGGGHCRGKDRPSRAPPGCDARRRYHHFRDRADLLEQLLAHWEVEARFLPSGRSPRDPAEALATIDAQVRHLIEERDYDPRFDMAVRAWAQADAVVAAAVERLDRRRIAALTRIFVALGCDRSEAAIRARVLYFHQIGYYAIGVKATAAARLRAADRYVHILCGEHHLERARAWAARHTGAPTRSVRPA
jgi:hypothetical protein